MTMARTTVCHSNSKLCSSLPMLNASSTCTLCLNMRICLNRQGTRATDLLAMGSNSMLAASQLIFAFFLALQRSCMSNCLPSVAIILKDTFLQLPLANFGSHWVSLKCMVNHFGKPWVTLGYYLSWFSKTSEQIALSVKIAFSVTFRLPQSHFSYTAQDVFSKSMLSTGTSPAKAGGRPCTVLPARPPPGQTSGPVPAPLLGHHAHSTVMMGSHAKGISDAIMCTLTTTKLTTLAIWGSPLPQGNGRKSGLVRC